VQSPNAIARHLHAAASVTVDSPEKQRVGVIGYCHGAADQGWSSAEVAAAVVFALTLSGCDLSTATPARRCRAYLFRVLARGRSVGFCKQ
jgi:hypothetical protein